MVYKQLAATAGVWLIAWHPVVQAQNIQKFEDLESCGNNRLSSEQDHALSRQLDTAVTYPTQHAGMRISKVTLKQLNVFDTDKPEENNALFRFANRAHLTTKPEVIENVLLFAEGDVYQTKKLIESERLLRSQFYLYDARIYAEEACDGNIEVTVITRDLWTLMPELSFSRSGGENSTRIGFRESNLFGYGKRLSLTHTKEVERSGYLFVYEDPNILSSRYRGRLEYSDNDDGERHYLSLSYPFFATDTPYSYGTTLLSDKRIESSYNAGEKVSEYQQNTTVSQIYFGLSKTLEQNWTRRLLFGYREEKQQFYETLGTALPLPNARAYLSLYTGSVV